MKTIVDLDISLTDFYSPPLANDQQFVALAAAMDPLLRQFVADLQMCIIYSNIGNQPEWLYDYLAVYCFDLDYYDLSFPLSTKRKLVQEVLYRKSIKVRREQSLIICSWLSPTLRWWSGGKSRSTAIRWDRPTLSGCRWRMISPIRLR
jgi:hypothetical protein